MPGLTTTSWKKGQSGNPNGRPKKPEIDALRTAIKVVEKENDMTLLEHFVRRAYENDSVLVALCKKFLPDMKSIEGGVEVRHKILQVFGMEPIYNDKNSPE